MGSDAALKAVKHINETITDTDTLINDLKSKELKAEVKTNDLNYVPTPEEFKK